jgi:hypothetical protein
VRPQAVVLFTIAVVLATVAFGIGAALEKATVAGTPSATASNQSSGSEVAGSSETAGESTAATGETVLGINPESVPLIVGAIVGSLALAGGVWLYWRRPAVLWPSHRRGWNQPPPRQRRWERLEREGGLVRWHAQF